MLGLERLISGDALDLIQHPRPRRLVQATSHSAHASVLADVSWPAAMKPIRLSRTRSSSIFTPAALGINGFHQQVDQVPAWRRVAPPHHHGGNPLSHPRCRWPAALLRRWSPAVRHRQEVAQDAKRPSRDRNLSICRASSHSMPGKSSPPDSATSNSTRSAQPPRPPSCRVHRTGRAFPFLDGLLDRRAHHRSEALHAVGAEGWLGQRAAAISIQRPRRRRCPLPHTGRNSLSNISPCGKSSVRSNRIFKRPSRRRPRSAPRPRLSPALVTSALVDPLRPTQQRVRRRPA